jgi:L-cystine uptake protein TcyP (sodium:dicarboxylate symporter family)
MNKKRFSAIIYIFLFCTREKIILRIPLEIENKLKIILQILSQTCPAGFRVYCLATSFRKSVELFSIYSHCLVILLQIIIIPLVIL